MRLLYLIRHGESTALARNQAARPGDDSPLSPRGRAQAAAVAAFLAEQPIELILSSVLRRAQETAAVLSASRVDCRHYASALLNEFQLRPDGTGVETTEQGLVRGLGFLNSYRPYAEAIAVVGHNALLSVLRLSFLNARWSEGQAAFAALGCCAVLRYDPDRGDECWREVATFVPADSDVAAG
jgi:broad specificity phosphatase PhoE